MVAENTATVAENTSIEVTREQQAEIYRAAFNQVCNKTDWKLPIDCIVPWDLANLYMQAIEFMTGSKAKGEALTGNRYWLRAAGYYVATGE